MDQWSELDELWDWQMCTDCMESEKDEFVQGLPKCKSVKCGYTCKHLENLPERLGHLKGDPRDRITAGGLIHAMRISGEISALSSRDTNGIPCFDGANVWSGDVPYSESLFWSLMASIVSFRRAKAIEKFRSLRNG